MKLNISTLAQWGNGEYNRDTQVTGVKVDQRLIESGDLFVCLRGERVDGHSFAATAVEMGAQALLVDHYLDLDVPQIKVNDTLEAFHQMGKAYRNHLDVFIVGITGSNGKTSTKDIINTILDDSIATHMNQNTEIGTLLNIFKMDETTKYGIFEIGLIHQGDVRLISSILEPDAAIVTSLAPAHLADFDSIEHIAQEKFEIFNYTKNKDLCFYQSDFPLYKQIATAQHTFGFNLDNEYVASDVALNNDGITFKVNGEAYACNLLGEHQASNCAGVIGLMLAMGISKEQIKERLTQVNLTSLRTEIVEYDNALLLLDAYKSNVASLMYALDILSSYDYKGDRIAFLSDMVELGDMSQEEHIKVLNQIDKLGLKHVYTLGPEFKQAQSKSNLDISQFSNTEDFTEFKQQFKQAAQEKDMILIKGSRSYALERLIKED